MTNISEIAKKLSERITNAETRQRYRTPNLLDYNHLTPSVIS